MRGGQPYRIVWEYERPRRPLGVKDRQGPCSLDHFRASCNNASDGKGEILDGGRGGRATAAVFGGGGEGADLADAESRVGEVIGKYQLLKCIGSGGMGVVYLAEDPLMNRRVAIKILLKEVAKNPVVLQRFLTEAQVTGRLNHPNIIAIYDVVLDKGNVSIVMELLKLGSVMQQIQQRGPLHWIEASRIIADCCSALVATHEAGLIHRDIKPGNILCSPAGIAKLVDFGMVKELPQTTDAADNSLANHLLGTATYMSPEQIAGKPIDKRSDIYSLGVTYFELLGAAALYRPGSADLLPAHRDAKVDEVDLLGLIVDEDVARLDVLVGYYRR